ncbi:MAG: hypothetical protein A2Y38_09210 [Spirochaetes bacterium GWB1_59_5]|nr:MAG: hypothetical protein A2Y38_09210 [Spirochaetes bacterium GWB1_59_5]
MPSDYLWGPSGEKLPIKKDRPPHFASRDRAGQFLDLIWNVLPDPDPILARAGKSYSGLRELMMDEQVETAWTSREAAVTRTPWDILPGAPDRQSRKIADFCRELYRSYKLKTINQGLLEHVLYGFIPAELIWDTVDGKWIPLDIVPKPQEWFAFNNNNQLVFRPRLGSFEELPPHRFLLIQHRPSFTNPYGVKLLSKIFWSVTFRRNGARWWAVFTEKYGGAFATAKHRSGAPEKEIDDILHTLEDLVTCGVAVFPEGTTIDISTDGSKSQATGNFREFESFFNENISKVILGATLTTDIGSTGSFSAAQVHNDVRNDIALSDRDSLAEAHDDVLKLVTRFNFGDSATPPVFAWEEPEDLKAPTAERDSKLYTMGWRPTKEYIMATYGISEEHFELSKPAPDGVGFSSAEPSVQVKSNSVRLSNFGIEEDDADFEQFIEERTKEGQIVIDAMFSEYSKDADQADSYDEAFELMLKRYPRQTKHRKRFASIIDNVRYAVSQLSASSEKTKKP